MSDIFGDDFAAASPPVDQEQATEEDPAAAFLAQQENEIAGLESEAFGMGDATGLESEAFGMGDATPQETNEYAGTNGYDDDFLRDAPAEQIQGGDDDLFNAPTSYEGGMGGGGDSLENGADDFTEMDPSQAYAAIAAADVRISELRAEPPKITQWREEHNSMLQEKDAQEEIKKEEWKEQARKEVEDWERNRLEQLEKTKANNRTAEKEFIGERDENKPGSEWERVAKLCDFNPKSSRGTKDVSRMRSTLLQLKQHNLVRPMVGK